MIKSSHVLILLLTLGFFFSPTLSFACAIKIEKTCCKNDFSSKTGIKNCCSKNKSTDENKSCGGICGHSNCSSTSSTNYSLFSFTAIEFKDINFDFSTEKQRFNNSKTFISSGFSTIWLIPKIS